MTDQHDAFSDVDSNSKQDFDLDLADFPHDSVLCLSIICVPDCVNDEIPFSLEDGPKFRLEHQPLDVCNGTQKCNT